MQTGTVISDNAELVFDYEGSGPLLLTISGGGGTAPRFAPISSLLKDDYTVVRYDRRGNSRSTGDKTKPLDMAQQARDAAAIINALGKDGAYVLGESAGANIALALVADHPNVVRGAVFHEPPIISLLPDAAEQFAFLDEVADLYEREGAPAAMHLFAKSIIGFAPTVEADERRMGDADATSNLDFFFAKEFHNISHFKPNLERLKHSKVPMVAVAGKKSGTAYYARSTKLLSEAIGCRFSLMSEHHLGFIAEPATFAAEIRPLLNDLRQS
ncbi:alpha/beta fold hydrolase [Rhizorhabdus dicambivorans]|nr:alpha/beta hydrolase [Rhizorhabdus dicambivorans]